MVTPARLSALLFGSFGIPPPASPPSPAPPERFPAVFKPFGKRSFMSIDPDTTTSPAIPAGYMRDSKGRLVPDALVKPADKLEDQLVRKMMGYADELSAQIARFKEHSFSDVGAFVELLAEQYGATKGGVKGNMTFTSYDGTLKVQVAVADTMSFRSELQIAKTLIDQCIQEWSEGASVKIRALVEHAFKVDKAGQVSRDAIFSLRRLEIEDEKWNRAMDAIGASIKVESSKTYVRFYRRPTPEKKWEAVTLDLASA